MKVVGIFHNFDQKEYEFEYLEKYEDFVPEDRLIFQDSEGKEEYGTFLYVHDIPHDPALIISDRNILRKPTLHDIQKIEANEERNRQAMEIFRQKIAEHNLEMYLMNGIYSLDGSKINFIFTAADRVDFRELVKNLAKTFQKQIHLQQIGPRDKAKIIGGYGRCGQETCCSRFLPKMESITMDMVRVQGLSNKGSEKLSGLCGKLLCCLKYEVKQYSEMKRKLPDLGETVRLKDGKEGRILGLDILNRKMKLLLSDESILFVDTDEIKEIKKNLKKEEVNVGSI